MPGKLLSADARIDNSNTSCPRKALSAGAFAPVQASSAPSRTFDMERQQQIRTWLAGLWPGRSFALAPASADARVVAALKQEVAQLRTTNELLRRSHEQVVRENQQLQAKLERLEHIFESDER